ncbi:hypothetical protein KCP74_14725 [Salmonella enterica subsp. enterica]|nr:hypothetical protein KCP74_14725 [Salmonella enterica subsp. enterica]
MPKPPAVAILIKQVLITDLDISISIAFPAIASFHSFVQLQEYRWYKIAGGAERQKGPVGYAVAALLRGRHFITVPSPPPAITAQRPVYGLSTNRCASPFSRVT